MSAAMKKVTTIDEYISLYPQNVQDILKELRQRIKDIVPEASEVISYGIPTFKLNGNLVHFGAFKHHIGFFPTSSAIEEFREELSPYAGSKGTVRFPLDKPLPYGLITKVVKFRVKKNLEKGK